MKKIESVKPEGFVNILIENKDGAIKSLDYKNTILLMGRLALARSLANLIGPKFDFYISRMLFGDGGTTDGVKKYVNGHRNGLFGVVKLSKPVISNLDESVPAQVIFTSVIRYEDAVGISLSEMALQMSNGDLYSMATFPDLNKTEDMQITFNWRINFI